MWKSTDLKIGIMLSVVLVAYFIASNILGGVSPTISNVVYSQGAVSFDVSVPVSRVSNQAGECVSAEPFIHWDCPVPVGAEMKLNISR